MWLSCVDMERELLGSNPELVKKRLVTKANRLKGSSFCFSGTVQLDSKKSVFPEAFSKKGFCEPKDSFFWVSQPCNLFGKHSFFNIVYISVREKSVFQVSCVLFSVFFGTVKLRVLPVILNLPLTGRYHFTFFLFFFSVVSVVNLMIQIFFLALTAVNFAIILRLSRLCFRC